jgi:hypothetical protein
MLECLGRLSVPGNESEAMLQRSSLAAALFSTNLVLCLQTSGASAGSVVLTDSTFNSMTAGGNYTSDPAVAISYSAPCSTCGQSGVPALQVVVNASEASSFSSADIGFIDNNLGTYNPSTQGAISSISASVNKLITTTGNFTNSTPYTNTFHPMIYQDGTYYIANISGPSYTAPGTTGWNLLSESGLTASDFTSFDLLTDTSGTSNPNFAGDLMEFGLVQITSQDIGGISTIDFDPLTLELTQTPIPAALPLFAGGLGVMGLFGRRRKRKG